MHNIGVVCPHAYIPGSFDGCTVGTEPYEPFEHPPDTQEKEDARFVQKRAKTQVQVFSEMLLCAYLTPKSRKMQLGFTEMTFV